MVVEFVRISTRVLTCRGGKTSTLPNLECLGRRNLSGLEVQGPKTAVRDRYPAILERRTTPDAFDPLSLQSSFEDSLVSTEWDRLSAPAIIPHRTWCSIQELSSSLETIPALYDVSGWYTPWDCRSERWVTMGENENNPQTRSLARALSLVRFRESGR